MNIEGINNSPSPCGEGRGGVIILTGVVWMVFFTLAKVVFALTCGEATLTETAIALWHGLRMDLSTTCYFLSMPVIITWISLLWHRLPLRHVLLPWNALCAMMSSAAVIIDASLYPYWNFKLDATILNYIDSPADAVASVSWWFVTWRVLLWLLLTVALTWTLWRLSAKSLRRASQWWHCAMPFVCAFLFLCIRGGVGESTMNVGVCYHSQRMFLNHVSVNPLFSFIASIDKTEDFASQFDLLPEDERQSIFDELYPKKSLNPVASAPTSDEARPIATKKDAPNVLLILWESGGGTFYAPFGGYQDVMVNMEQLASEGLFFSQMYSNSWRTDRGIVSILSGHFAYPTLTLMRLPVACDRLPGLGLSFKRHGYDTFFMYGGDINFTHTGGYLTSAGYEQLISDRDFSMAERHTEQWGVTDSITFNRLYDEVVSRSRAGHRWHGGILTLSSHEPFIVPFHKHINLVFNAMAYTDHCIGRFISRLKKEEDVWRDLLVVIMPDHGICLGDMTVYDDRYFRSPMVWTGGALETVSTAGTSVDKIMNQSDLPATLLSAIGFDHSDYPFSRDVLDSSYTYPFAYSNTTETVMFRDSVGPLFFNIKTMAPENTDDPVRLRRLKAILQTSYDNVELM